LRYSLIAAYCWLRAQEITDDLIELLIQIIHRIGASAERRVERELLGTMKRVTGKNTLLCRLAETALANPDGIIREVLFPVIDEQTLADLVKELKSTGAGLSSARLHGDACLLQPPLQTGDPCLVGGAGVSFQQPDSPTRDPGPRRH
jgi:hypothetical protein